MKYLGIILFSFSAFAQISSPVTPSIKLRPGQTYQFQGTCPAGHTCEWRVADGHDPSSSISAGGLYTAPSTYHRHGALGGCPVQAHNSIFNVNISSLPVMANSDNMVAQIVTNSWGSVHLAGENIVNPVNNATPKTALQPYYNKQWFGTYPLPTPPYYSVGSRNDSKARTQSGWRISGTDNRVMAVNTDTCAIDSWYMGGAYTWETYYGPTSPFTSTWYNVYDGVEYDSLELLNGLGLKGAVHSANASGMYHAPMQLDYTDWIRAVDTDGAAGVVPHALGMTLSNLAIVKADYSGGKAGIFLWPATMSAGGATGGLTKYGTRLRLKASFVSSFPYASAENCSARCQTFVRVFYNGLRDYGAFVMDGTQYIDSGAVHVRTQGAYDADLLRAVDVLLRAKSNGLGNALANLEAVDESSLMSIATSNVVHAAAAEPEWVQYYDLTTSSVVGSKDVIITPATVGAARTQIQIVAGANPVDLKLAAKVWATGFAPDPDLTWSVTPSGTGALSAGGAYTPPASLAAPKSLKVHVAATADPTAYVDLRVIVYPPIGRGLYIRAYSSVVGYGDYTDSAGRKWWQNDDAGKELNPSGTNNPSDYGSAATITPLDPSWPAVVYKAGSRSEQAIGWYLPNARYKITALTTTFSGTADLSSYKTSIDLNGSIAFPAASIWGLAGSRYNVGYNVALSKTITGGELVFGWRPTGTFTTSNYPYLAAFAIEPDTTPLQPAGTIPTWKGKGKVTGKGKIKR